MWILWICPLSCSVNFGWLLTVDVKFFKNYWPISYPLQFIWLTPNNWICHGEIKKVPIIRECAKMCLINITPIFCRSLCCHLSFIYSFLCLTLFICLLVRSFIPSSVLFTKYWHSYHVIKLTTTKNQITQVTRDNYILPVNTLWIQLCTCFFKLN